MESIDTYLKNLEDLYWVKLVFELVAVSAFIAFVVGIFVIIRSSKSILSHSIESRKTEFLKKLDDVIQEYKMYVYSFDAETYSKRKQPNEILLTYKSQQLNARLDQLIKMRRALNKKHFDDLDSVERSLREINHYVNSTYGMMIKLRNKPNQQFEP